MDYDKLRNGIGPLMYDLEQWCTEITIKYSKPYQWTGIAFYKDGFSTNWQSTSLGEVILYLWEKGKEKN